MAIDGTTCTSAWRSWSTWGGQDNGCSVAAAARADPTDGVGLDAAGVDMHQT